MIGGWVFVFLEAVVKVWTWAQAGCGKSRMSGFYEQGGGAPL